MASHGSKTCVNSCSSGEHPSECRCDESKSTVIETVEPGDSASQVGSRVSNASQSTAKYLQEQEKKWIQSLTYKS